MRNMRTWTREILIRCALGLSSLCSFIPSSFGQAGGTPVVRVESNLVVVPVLVLDKNILLEAGPNLKRCAEEEFKIFVALRPSDASLPKDCDYNTVRGLVLQDFYIFEDGIQQKIQNLTVETMPGALIRDNYGKHWEWFSMPRAKWSTTDLWTATLDAGFHLYEIAYIPTKHDEGSCHKIKVKVNHRNAAVFARDEYCYNSEVDPLNGTSLAKRMEQELLSEKVGKIDLHLQAGYVYTSGASARVQLALEFPWTRLQHEWSDGTFHATIGLLGMVYKKDGSVAARFSDFACCGPEPSIIPPRYTDLKDRAEYEASEPDNAAKALPARYEAQIDLPAGEYDLRLVLSDGSKYGRAEAPLIVDAYGEKQLALSSVLLCKRFRDAGAAAREAATKKLAPQYVPLVSNGLQLTPTGDTRFAKGERLMAYFEIYEPLPERDSTTGVKAQLRIVNSKTGTVEKDYGVLDSACCRKSGSATIPIGLEVTIDKMLPGTYRLEVQAYDAMGHQTGWRSTNFTVE